MLHFTFLNHWLSKRKAKQILLLWFVFAIAVLKRNVLYQIFIFLIHRILISGGNGRRIFYCLMATLCYLRFTLSNWAAGKSWNACWFLDKPQLETWVYLSEHFGLFINLSVTSFSDTKIYSTNINTKVKFERNHVLYISKCIHSGAIYSTETSVSAIIQDFSERRKKTNTDFIWHVMTQKDNLKDYN